MPPALHSAAAQASDKAAILVEALPYIRQFRDRFVVVKLGGSAQDDPAILRRVFADLDFMLAVGMRPVVVYGGGKKITAAMQALGKPARFIEGQRVTDAETMEVVARVLCDEVGPELARLLAESGGAGQLLNGRDHAILRAVKKNIPERPDADLGWVGEPVALDAAPLYRMFERPGAPRTIPLIAPIARGCARESHFLYNINGDTAAALAARDLGAEKLVFLSDIPGVFRDPADPATLVSSLDRTGVAALRSAGGIQGGMIPKVEACLFALEGGVRKAHIVPGEQPHALLLEIFTRAGVGTEITL